jgi:hypothetical protein
VPSSRSLVCATRARSSGRASTVAGQQNRFERTKQTRSCAWESRTSFSDWRKRHYTRCMKLNEMVKEYEARVPSPNVRQRRVCRLSGNRIMVPRFLELQPVITLVTMLEECRSACLCAPSRKTARRLSSVLRLIPATSSFDYTVLPSFLKASPVPQPHPSRKIDVSNLKLELHSTVHQASFQRFRGACCQAAAGHTAARQS